MVCLKCGKDTPGDECDCARGVLPQYSLCLECARDIMAKCFSCGTYVPLSEYIPELVICKGCLVRVHKSINHTRWKNLYQLLVIGGFGILNFILVVMMVYMFIDFSW